MHQTFYIDPEEEISSVIDRLNKSMSASNYFVVPKRALFLQSIVNLKLLKREADKVSKRVIIVTQDEVGASMAQRSGIEVRPTLDGLESVLDASDEEVEEDDVEENAEYVAPRVVPPAQQEKQVRLSGVGSDDFFVPSFAGVKEDTFQATTVKSSPKSIHVNSVSAPERTYDLPKREIPRAPQQNQLGAKAVGQRNPQVITGLGRKQNLDLEKERTLERMYAPRDNNKKAEDKTVPVQETRVKKVFIGFIGLCLVALAGVAVFLFLPSAKIVVEPNILKDKVDLDLFGSSNVGEEKNNIPIRTVDKEESITLAYAVQGSAAVSGKKAHGDVVIYNEYDSNPQTLIATTRFESADGKIFRLVKNVIVPGATNVAGELKPGAIEAEIIADQPGTDYNLEPTKFSIPGFKGSPKYDKFYAKSSQPIKGGSTDGETTGGVVSQRDIDNARQKTEAAIKEKFAQLLKDELPEGDVILEQAEKITILSTSANAKLGDMVSSLDYTVTARLHAIVFSENDVKKEIELTMNNDQQSGAKVEKRISKIEYGTVNADFDKDTLELKVYGEVMLTPIIDTDQIMQELLGKTDDQLASILRKYSTIKSVNVEFQPSFVTRIPQYAQRVQVEIKKEQ